MITFIFHGPNLPRSHSPFVSWLLAIPVDFCRLRKPRKGVKLFPLKFSLRLMLAGKRANPKLWNLLAHVASDRFMADPDRDSLPLLEEWRKEKKASKTASKARDASFSFVPQPRMTRFMAKRDAQMLLAILERKEEPRDLRVLLNELEGLMLGAFSSQDVIELYGEILSSLMRYPNQIPHASTFAQSLGYFIRSLH